MASGPQELTMEEREAILRIVRDVQASRRTMDWGDHEPPRAGHFAGILQRDGREVCRVEDVPWLPDAIARCHEKWVAMGKP